MGSKRNSHRLCATPGCRNTVSKKNRKKGALCSVCLGGQVEEAAAKVTGHKPKSDFSVKMAALRKSVKGGSDG